MAEQDREPDATELIEEASALAMLPMTMAAAWWEAALKAWQPPRTPPVEPGNHQPCHELHVPDPVEEDGERSLFA